MIYWIVGGFLLMLAFRRSLGGEWRSFLVWGALAMLAAAIFYRRRLGEEIAVVRKKIADDLGLLKNRRKEWLYDKWKNWGEPFVVAALLAFVIRTYLVGPYKIPTGSMIPTFLVGDRIFVDKISYRFHPPKRGDIIVFKYPLEPKKDFVKRLVGLPGDRLQIKDGKILLNGTALEEAPFSEHYYYNRDDWEWAKEGQVIQVPADGFFAMGDNSAQSSDSRHWGFVPKKNMVGKAIMIWWPPNRIKFVK